MKRNPSSLKAGMIAVALLAGACGGAGDSVAGTYSCKAPGEPEVLAFGLEVCVRAGIAYARIAEANEIP